MNWAYNIEITARIYQLGYTIKRNYDLGSWTLGFFRQFTLTVRSYVFTIFCHSFIPLCPNSLLPLHCLEWISNGNIAYDKAHITYLHRLFNDTSQAVLPSGKTSKLTSHKRIKYIFYVVCAISERHTFLRKGRTSVLSSTGRIKKAMQWPIASFVINLIFRGLACCWLHSGRRLASREEGRHSSVRTLAGKHVPLHTYPHNSLYL